MTSSAPPAEKKNKMKIHVIKPQSRNPSPSLHLAQVKPIQLFYAGYKAIVV